MYRFTGFFVGLASYVLLAPAAQADAAGLAIETPKPLPSMHYTDEMRLVHQMSENKGKLTAIHFWATWCVPCIAELPQVDAAAKTYGDKGLTVIAISLDGDHMAKVREFFTAHNITTLKPSFDANMDAFGASGAGGLPATLFVDAGGNEIARANGPLNWQAPDVIQFIESHLK